MVNTVFMFSTAAAQDLCVFAEQPFGQCPGHQSVDSSRVSYETTLHSVVLDHYHFVSS